jgi:hypothetical protein
VKKKKEDKMKEKAKEIINTINYSLAVLLIFIYIKKRRFETVYARGNQRAAYEHPFVSPARTA